MGNKLNNQPLKPNESCFGHPDNLEVDCHGCKVTKSCEKKYTKGLKEKDPRRKQVKFMGIAIRQELIYNTPMSKKESFRKGRIVSKKNLNRYIKATRLNKGVKCTGTTQ